MRVIIVVLTGRSSENIYVAAVQALRKRETTEHETQFTTKIGGKV